jgi:hypothetical protein
MIKLSVSKNQYYRIFALKLIFRSDNVALSVTCTVLTSVADPDPFFMDPVPACHFDTDPAVDPVPDPYCFKEVM